MKRFFRRFRQFFFPAPEASRWMKLLPYTILIVLFLSLVISGAYVWDYTNSSEFCGSACHGIHPAENITYLSSPHAEVKCVECHIGRAFIGNQITRKAGDIRHVTAAVLKNYEYPLHVKTLRPAREVCERCHNPDKFSDDSQRVIYHYGSDIENTLNRTYMVMKTGGGTVREGQGDGIHWHIKNKVLYYATDESEQNIPYIKVFDEEYSAVYEYVDISTDFSPFSIDETDLKEMDCITCHNRISHSILVPEDSVDSAISRGLISSEIPEIQRKAVEVLSASYESKEKALRDIDLLRNFYRDTYADFQQEHIEDIDQAILVIKDIYQQSVFPDQMMDWDTHSDNLGHMNDPGCFRCHDGKHLDLAGYAIRLECNLCHAIPVITGPEDLETQILISHEEQPRSHRNPNWIALHRFVYDENDENEYCSDCHDVSNFGEANNTSFCSNSACHHQTWESVDLDVLDNGVIFEKIVQQLSHYPDTLEPVEAWGDEPSLDEIHREQEEMLCEDCHVDFPPLGPPPNEICIECHGESIKGVEELTAMYEPNPHDSHYGEDYPCSSCHPNFGFVEPIDSCAFCHAMEELQLIEGTSSQ
ncbi:MAG: cytochrome c3 family protein [Anaerolineales bacterium]|nr:cytochrome c3 family protein [Anaerolineales bacterium]